MKLALTWRAWIKYANERQDDASGNQVVFLCIKNIIYLANFYIDLFIQTLRAFIKIV